ncbi:hypothetical protein [Streptomyces sp. NBC_01314]|nr:hypothetical protein OG622_35560 [Streptomyces sp. NBC_01314]
MAVRGSRQSMELVVLAVGLVLARRDHAASALAVVPVREAIPRELR